MAIRFLLLLPLLGCAVMETVEGYIDSPGVVYICDGHNPDGSQIEYCWDGDATEIESATGLDCHATGLFERTSLVGCWWHCGPERGCNSSRGCWGCE